MKNTQRQETLETDSNSGQPEHDKIDQPNNVSDEQATHYDSNQQVLDQLLATEKSYALFLDIDGTLSEFKNDPRDSFIPKATLNIINKFAKADVTIAFVTGRDLLTAQHMIKPLDLPVAALHGLEIYINEQDRLVNHVNYDELNQVMVRLYDLKDAYPEFLIENKLNSVALHYRTAPQLESIAKTFMHELKAQFSELKLIEGKYVFELISKQADKGKAIKNLLEHLNLTQCHPIFIGDDKTDESGFKAINQFRGTSIKVGEGQTHAQFRLASIEDVASFLFSFSEQHLKAFPTRTLKKHGEQYV